MYIRILSWKITTSQITSTYFFQKFFSILTRINIGRHLLNNTLFKIELSRLRTRKTQTIKASHIYQRQTIQKFFYSYVLINIYAMPIGRD